MSNVNNLNIFTFIKDIYQSLKHIDKNFNDFNDTINVKIAKLEDNQQILLDKLTNIETLLENMSQINRTSVGLDKNLESQLLEKMSIMNNNNSNNDKIDLKPEELTFENILENNYSFQDINESLSINNNIIPDMNINNLNKSFSSSSGSSYYTSSNSTNTSSNTSLNNLLF
jgi:hypothetical protein